MGKEREREGGAIKYMHNFYKIRQVSYFFFSCFVRRQINIDKKEGFI